MARKMVTIAKQTVGKFILVEKECIKDGVYEDTICFVRRSGSKSKVVYCSIADALRHKCEWFYEEENVA